MAIINSYYAKEGIEGLWLLTIYGIKRYIFNNNLTNNNNKW